MSREPQLSTRYDVAIVGGGHNGLTAGTYLAKAGLRVIVLERREIAGGMTAPVEYFPGYTASITNSPGSLEPIIITELELERYGLQYLRPDPALVYPFPGGRGFVGWRDRAASLAQIAKFSARDAKRYYPFFQYLDDFASRLNVSIHQPPPRFAELVSRIDDDESEEMFSKIMFGSVKDLLDEWFESDEVKALVASVAIVANLAGPRTPGTVMRLMARPLSLRSMPAGDVFDPRRQVMRGSTGLPRGGMGAIAVAMTNAFRAAGGVVKTNAEVVSIEVRDGRCGQVVLAGGDTIEAGTVVSNLNPRTTLLELVDDAELPTGFRERLRQVPTHGSAFKLGLALDGVPEFAMATTKEEVERFAACQFRIAPSMDYMERAYDDAKYGFPAQEPMLWGLTPSVLDDTVTPPGKHVMSVNIFHVPYQLATGSWETEKDVFGKRCIDTLEQYVPDIKNLISDVRFWSPADLQDEYGLLGGNITHGDTMPGQMFSFRPVAGWSAYRTPIEGLYLCGAGTWPGGSVSGVPGRNASQAVLADLSREA